MDQQNQPTQPTPPVQTPKPTPNGPPAPVQNKTGKSKGGLVAIIIIASVVVLAGLCVGTWYGWKYIAKNYLNKSTSPPTSSSITLAELETALKYPTSTLTATDHSKKGGYTSELTMEATDNVQTVYNYYINLATEKKWTVSSKSLETDNSRGTVTLVGASNEFEVLLTFVEATNGTTIYASIDAENLKTGESTSTTPTTTPSTATTSPSTSKKTISTDYVISDSSTRLVTTSELTNLTPWELKVARNEIYARHGREFVHQDLQCYFNTKSWYATDPNFSESSLTQIENANVATIQGYEISTGSPLQSTDSGC